MQEGASCESPDKQIGRCIDIYQCPVVTELLSRSITPEVRQFVRSLQCGFNGNKVLVCCPQQTTRKVIDEPEVSFKIIIF